MSEWWEVRKNGKAYAGGPIITKPDSKQLRSMSAAGYHLYLDGKRASQKAGEDSGK